MNSQLLLEKLYLHVNLGHTTEERQLPQWVSLQIKFEFNSFPDACNTDCLTDTVCYAHLVNDLQAFCDHRSFKLIESFAYQLYQFLKKKLAEKINTKTNISLCVTKNLKLATLEQASFSISD